MLDPGAWSEPVKSIPYSHILSLESIMILSCDIRQVLPNGLFFFSRIPTKILYAFHICLTHDRYMVRPSHPPWLIHSNVCIFFFNGSSSAFRALASYSVPESFFSEVGLLGRVISPSQGLYLNTGQHKHRINAYTHHTSMPWLGFEPTIPASKRATTVHALDRPATVTGCLQY
jgi:hypothetical protein